MSTRENVRLIARCSLLHASFVDIVVYKVSVAIPAMSKVSFPDVLLMKKDASGKYHNSTNYSDKLGPRKSVNPGLSVI